MAQPKTLAEFVAIVAPKLRGPVRFVEVRHMQPDYIAFIEGLDVIHCGSDVFAALNDKIAAQVVGA